MSKLANLVGSPNASGQPEPAPTFGYRLIVIMDVALGALRFEWSLLDSNVLAATGQLLPSSLVMFRRYALEWQFQMNDQQERDRCSRAASSARS